MQVVLMNLPKNDFIEMEIHPENDQFFRVEQGQIRIIAQKDTKALVLTGEAGFACILPKGTKHKIMNNGQGDLKVYTIYSPPHHAPDKIDPVHKEKM